jgi:two-component system response regulator AlgR
MIPRVFIVDDEGPARARLKTLLSDIASTCPHQLVGEADQAGSALEAIPEALPDIVLLDVQMPGMNGIELAARLTKDLDKAPAIVFISAYEEFALKAFDVQALDYLLKPVRASRLAEAIQRVVRLVSQHAESNSLPVTQDRRKHFTVQERGRVLLVPVAEVLYLKAELKYVTLRTKERDYLIEESLQSIEDELADTFVRVHRNALVARQAITGVERAAVTVDADADAGKPQETWQVILRDVEEKLLISRRQWPVVKALVR